MGTVVFALRAQARLRWRSWVAVTLLISVVGGLVLASMAAGRRTDAAFPAFLAQHGFDAAVYAQHPVPAVVGLPDVAAFATITGPLSGKPVCRCTHPINPANLSVESIVSHRAAPFALVAGRLPYRARTNEVLASFTLQQQNDVQVGSVIHLPLYARSQASLLDGEGASPRPTGPIVALRVVGIEASEVDFPAGSAPLDELLVTPAFRRTVMRHTANSIGYAIRLKGGASELPRFDAEVGALKAPAGVANEDGESRSVEASIHGQTVGWWILALIAAIVGVAVLYQVLARQAAAERDEYPTLTALGANRRQLLSLGMARQVVVASAGALGAILVAVLLSPLAPLGEARLAEPSAGVRFDVRVLPLGALAVAVAVLILGLWPVWLSTRSARSRAQFVETRPSALVAHLAAAGAPPSLVIGARHALQARADGGRVAVSPAIVGAVLAVVALCGTVVFGSSLSHLTATPALYGDRYQLDFGTGQPDPSLLRTLGHDPAISNISEGSGTEVTINGTTVGALVVTAIRGPLLVSIASGHLPRLHQIGLGATTMRQIGAHVGSVVRVSFSSSRQKRTVPLRVVSQVALPILDGGTSLGTGAVFSIKGYEGAACPPGPSDASCRARFERGGGIGILAAAVPGQRGRADVTHYLNAYPSIAEPAVPPTSLVNFGEAVNFPFIVAGIVTVFGAATLMHLLIISVSRRRRELALLRVLGFVNRQIAFTVAWQAMVIALIGAVVGVPLGIVLGRTIWLAFAGRLGVVPVAIVDIPVLTALVICILLVANLLAVVPAVAARHIEPGQSLRAP
jgi:FtsX-like permease family